MWFLYLLAYSCTRDEEKRKELKETAMGLHLILDTETTTLPGVRAIVGDDSQKARNISTNLPLVYDIGWTIIDDEGVNIENADYLVKEFFTTEGRDEAYYADKWPKYMESVNSGNLEILEWEKIMELLDNARAKCEDVGAYNARFDFHKAIPYTSYYLANKDDAEWFKSEFNKAIEYATNPPDHKEADENCNYHLTEPTMWEFRGQNTTSLDIWNMACKTFLNTPQYKAWTIKTCAYADSRVYFPTDAENSYRFLFDKNEWIEDHTALSDAKIEAEIFTEIKRRYGCTANIVIMPCMKLGRTVDFIDSHRFYFDKNDLNNLYDALSTYYTTRCTYKGSWPSQVRNLLTKLDNIRKDYENMKYYSIKVKYIKESQAKAKKLTDDEILGLNRVFNIAVESNLEGYDLDEAIDNAIAIETEQPWLGMVFDSVLEVKELS